MSVLLSLLANAGALPATTQYDPYFEQVYALLHFDGANNSTAITNEGFGGVIYANTNAVISTVAPKFGTAALRFDDINDRLLSNAAAITYLGQDFTEEAWVRFDSITGNRATWSRGDYAGAGYELYLSSDNKLNLYGNGADMVSTPVLGLVANTYYHIAVVRRFGIWTIWVDGVLRATSTSLPFLIGGSSQVGLSGYSPNCYIDEYRLTNGVARYTANFTPPTAAFPDASAARVYATLNPSEKAAQHTLSNGNLTLASSSSGGRSIATVYKNTGKWFYEVTVTNVNLRIGWGTTSGNIGNNPGDEGGSFGWTSGGGVFSGGGVVTSTINWTAGDVLGVALDYATGWIKLYKNGTLVLNDYNMFGSTPTLRAPMGGADGAGTLGTFNFGATPFVYGPPSGYSGYVAYTTQYATWNPGDKSVNISLTGGDLTAVSASSAQGMVRSTLGKSSGKWYWEYTPTAAAGIIHGIANSSQLTSDWPGKTSNSFGYYGLSGDKWTNTINSAYGAAYTASDVIGVAMDMDSGTLTFYKNGVHQGLAFIGLSGTYYPCFGQSGGSAGNATYNFGATPFKYSVPPGYNPGLDNEPSISPPAQTYATWNPTDKSANVTLSNGNLTATGSGASTNQNFRANIGKTTGKWYWENINGNNIGISNTSQSVTDGDYPGATANSVSYNGPTGSIYANGSAVATVASFSNTDTVGLAVDFDAKTVSFYKNGVLQYTHTYVFSGTVYPHSTVYAGSAGPCTANFGQYPFKYAVPVGFNSGIY